MEKKLSTTIIPSSTPTSFTDYISLGVKPEEDGVVMLRLASILPDKSISENHRTIMQKAVARKLLNHMCNALDYFPRKKRTKKTAQKK